MVIGHNQVVLEDKNHGNGNKAVVDLAKPKLTFHGFFAWIIWMTLHLFLLIGFKNRLMVFINWIYKYFTHRQSLSLLFTQITKKEN